MLELLPYNWEWQGISEIYLNLTRSVGCVHHFAWKANSSEVRGHGVGARWGGTSRLPSGATRSTGPSCCQGHASGGVCAFRRRAYAKSWVLGGLGKGGAGSHPARWAGPGALFPAGLVANRHSSVVHVCAPVPHVPWASHVPVVSHLIACSPDVPPQWVVYLEPEDAKYSHWTPEECSSRWGEGPKEGRANTTSCATTVQSVAHGVGVSSTCTAQAVTIRALHLDLIACLQLLPGGTRTTW